MAANKNDPLHVKQSLDNVHRDIPVGSVFGFGSAAQNASHQVCCCRRRVSPTYIGINIVTPNHCSSLATGRQGTRPSVRRTRVPRRSSSALVRRTADLSCFFLFSRRTISCASCPTLGQQLCPLVFPHRLVFLRLCDRYYRRISRWFVRAHQTNRCWPSTSLLIVNSLGFEYIFSSLAIFSKCIVDNSFNLIVSL